MKTFGEGIPRNLLRGASTSIKLCPSLCFNYQIDDINFENAFYKQVIGKQKMRLFRVFILAFCVLLLSYAPANAGARKAPDWLISEWINSSGVTLSELKGKVVIIEFFQLWCPGCNKFTIPLMKQWNRTFKNQIESGKLKILSIHTVFEGREHQTPERLKSFVKEKDIHHLVGIDVHKKGEYLPETMKRYRTRGTPEVAIIDKNGYIRFQIFGGFEPAIAEKLIRRLIKEPI